MKQTAVEWFYENLKSHFEHDGDLLEVVQMSFEQAKEMEKEQIEIAFFKGLTFGKTLPDGLTAEQYYKETFKQQEQ
jgi:hypothetical protein